MKSYLSIVENVLMNGERKSNRTGEDTLYVPATYFEHDMNTGFPLLTSKKMSYKNIFSELEFFIKGIHDKNWLIERKNHIWDDWCTPDKVKYGNDESTIQKMKNENELGPIYGFQWRNFGADYTNGEKYKFKKMKKFNRVEIWGNKIYIFKEIADAKRNCIEEKSKIIISLPKEIDMDDIKDIGGDYNTETVYILTKKGVVYITSDLIDLESGDRFWKKLEENIECVYQERDDMYLIKFGIILKTKDNFYLQYETKNNRMSYIDKMKDENYKICSNTNKVLYNDYKIAIPSTHKIGFAYYDLEKLLKYKDENNKILKVIGKNYGVNKLIVFDTNNFIYIFDRDISRDEKYNEAIHNIHRSFKLEFADKNAKIVSILPYYNSIYILTDENLLYSIDNRYELKFYFNDFGFVKEIYTNGESFTVVNIENEMFVDGVLDRYVDDFSVVRTIKSDSFTNLDRMVPKGEDQFKNMIDTIKSNPDSRRIYVTAWNPNQLKHMALPPCHISFQVVVNKEKNKFDLVWYQRSCDLMLGIPYNIASYAALMHLIELETGYKANKLIGFLVDVHIYLNHIPNARKQLTRKTYNLPKIITKDFTNIYDWKYTDTSVEDYKSEEPLFFEIAI